MPVPFVSLFKTGLWIIVYESARLLVLRQLDQIHYQSLWICYDALGAFHTFVQSFCVEAQELSLASHHPKLMF